MKALPNFIIIGAGKSGTTALYEYLAEHPDVFMSPVKETNFFALEGKDVRPLEHDPDQMQHYPWSVTNWKDYLHLFDQVQNEKAIGEASPMYLYNSAAPGNIKRRLPGIKLIAILREPVDRLYSRYMHLAREGREPTENFIEVLDENSIWWRRNDLVKEGFYFRNLSRYYQLFEPTQIKVVLYDDLKNDPVKTIQSIYEFIGADPLFSPDLTTQYNVSGRIKNKSLDAIIGQNSLIKESLAKVSPYLVREIKKSTTLKRVVNKMRASNLSRTPLEDELRNRIKNKVYRQDIESLQQLIGRDLSKWLN